MLNEGEQNEQIPENNKITQEELDRAERFVLQNGLGETTDADLDRAEYEIELVAAKDLAEHLIKFRSMKIKKGELIKTAVNEALTRYGIEMNAELQYVLITQICVEKQFGSDINLAQGGENNTN